MDIRSKLRRYYFKLGINRAYKFDNWFKLSNLHNRLTFDFLGLFFNKYSQFDKPLAKYLYHYIKQDEEMFKQFNDEFNYSFVLRIFPIQLGHWLIYPFHNQKKRFHKIQIICLQEITYLLIENCFSKEILTKY